MRSVKPMTWAQRERQTFRGRKTGKYEKVNPCQLCGRSAGMNYYSDDRCDSIPGFGGDVCLVLCGKCATKTSKMGDTEARALFHSKAYGAEWEARFQESYGVHPSELTDGMTQKEQFDLIASRQSKKT